MTKKQNILYVVCAYAFFWLVCLLVLLKVVPSDSALMTILFVLGCWTPTITLLILFKKLFPGRSIKDFYKNAFKARLNFGMICVLTILQILIFVGAVSILAFSKSVSLMSMFNLSLQTIVGGFIASLIQGATGEESGWRGFLQPSVEKSFGVIKSSLIVGAIWVVWHLPVWFTYGYSPRNLIQYIITFAVSTMSIAIIMGICYSRCRNLFVPMWIHFMYNFVTTVFVGDENDAVNAFVWLAVFYVLAAIGYIVWYKKTSKKEAATVLS